MITPISMVSTPSGFALVLALLLIAPLAPAGVALLNTGLGRSRSAAQSLLGSLLLVASASLLFAIVGATFADGSTGPGHIATIAGKPWNWAGTGSWLLQGLGSSPSRGELATLFEFVALPLSVLIPWGSGADRWRLTAGAAAAALISAVT